jgi:hypothetical protein
MRTRLSTSEEVMAVRRQEAYERCARCPEMRPGGTCRRDGKRTWFLVPGEQAGTSRMRSRPRTIDEIEACPRGLSGGNFDQAGANKEAQGSLCVPLERA